MATNLQIDTKLLDEAQRIGGYKTKRETVNAALDELVRRFKRMQLLDLQNQIDYFDDYDYKLARQKR